MEEIVKALAQRANFDGIDKNELERIKEYAANLLEVAQQEEKNNKIDFYQDVLNRIDAHLNRPPSTFIPSPPTPPHRSQQVRRRRAPSGSPMERRLRQSSRFRSPRSPIRSPIRSSSRSPIRSSSPIRSPIRQRTRRSTSRDFRTPSPRGGKKTRKYRK